jgi:glutamine amidotransferase-like uncharacterized protein
MKSTIALFLCDPKCSVQSGNGIINSLQSHYNFKIFGTRPLEDNFFDDVDIVAVPGGIGDAESYHKVLAHSSDRIKKFVNRGGKYFGICMGAYWAGSNYLNILQDVDAVQYIKRPNTDTKRPHAKDISITWNGKQDKMFFYDGCALIGNERKFKTIARYANGDPMAIIQNNIGIIGCHPESEEFWYNSYKWLKGKYINQHHLLLNFVNDLNLTSK